MIPAQSSRTFIKQNKTKTTTKTKKKTKEKLTEQKQRNNRIKQTKTPNRFRRGGDLTSFTTVRGELIPEHLARCKIGSLDLLAGRRAPG